MPHASAHFRLLCPRVHASLLIAAMTQGPNAPQEIIGFRRSPALPGFDLVDAENSPREWRIVTHLFYVVVFKTWRGPVHMAGRVHQAEPGLVLCNRPNELMVGRPEDNRPGSFNVLEFTPSLLEEWLAEQPGRRRLPEWSAPVQPIGPDLSAKFAHFFDVFEPHASPLKLQSELLQLSEAMVQGLIAGMSESVARLDGPPIRGTARMRECLQEEGFDIDLETLARKVGLSRFQALRAFKRRYGLPPHAYQMAVRLGQARRMLSEGAAPVDVALRCGFVDQSHFTRHYRRAFGVTPMHYARGQQRSSGVYPAGHLAPGNPDELVSRSDRSRT